MAAVRACVTDDELQFLPRILDKLPFESSLFRFRGPGEALIYVKEPIKPKGESDQPPTHCLPDLKTAQGKTNDTITI